MNALTYASFFENISIDTPISEYEKVLDKKAKFKDPFHEVQGLENIYNIFQDMYKKLSKPKFRVIEVVEQKSIAYIKWNFIFQFKNSSKIEFFEGVSRVEFNHQGKVISHIDYWDSAQNLYEKIPILSYFIRLIKKRVKS